MYRLIGSKLIDSFCHHDGWLPVDLSDYFKLQIDTYDMDNPHKGILKKDLISRLAQSDDLVSYYNDFKTWDIDLYFKSEEDYILWKLKHGL